MLNKKGFTLIELLAIIVILAIIMIVAVPNITKEIKRSEKENQNILNQKIENASHLYASKYYIDNIVAKENFNFTLDELEEDGLITLKDACKNKRGEVIAVLDGKTYNYNKIEDSDCYDCSSTNGENNICE